MQRFLSKHVSCDALVLFAFVFLRPDREEASVMPLINAGFNRVSLIVTSAVCIRIFLSIGSHLSSSSTCWKTSWPLFRLFYFKYSFVNK